MTGKIIVTMTAIVQALGDHQRQREQAAQARPGEDRHGAQHRAAMPAGIAPPHQRPPREAAETPQRHDVVPQELADMEEERPNGPPCDDHHDHSPEHHHQRHPEMGEFAEFRMERPVARRGGHMLGEEDADPRHEDDRVDVISQPHGEARPAHGDIEAEAGHDYERHDERHDREKAGIAAPERRSRSRLAPWCSISPRMCQATCSVWGELCRAVRKNQLRAPLRLRSGR
jgi:hypothetical protein